MKFIHLSYDIPVDPETQEGVFPNPSDALRRYAIRHSYSCWIVPAARLPTALMDRMKAAGCKVRVLEFAAHEEDSIREIYREEMGKEAARLHGILIQSMDKAGRALDAAEKAMFSLPRERVEELHRRERFLKAKCNEAAKGLKAAVECAVGFDETENSDHLFKGLEHAIAARRAAIRAEEEARRYLVAA